MPLRVEDCRCIDIARLRRAGYLDRPGRFQWKWARNPERMGFAVCSTRDGQHYAMVYFARTSAGQWRQVTQTFDVDWIPCRFGGRRPYFKCECGARVTALHSPAAGRRFSCRHCYGLTYATRLASDRERAFLGLRRQRDRLGASDGLEFPDRPQGMHRRRYERLRDEYERREGEAIAQFCSGPLLRGRCVSG